MKWSRNEIPRLLPVLEQISSDLAPVDGKNILVLCSGTGEVAFWLGEMMEQGHVTGLELDEAALDISRRTAHEMGLDQVIEFLPAQKTHIPMPDASFDALVCEFIVYPSSMPAEIGQAEMARVLKPGGKLILTDVIVTRPLPDRAREDLASIGLDYLSEDTQAGFRARMGDSGLINLVVRDLTSIIKIVLEDRADSDFAASHQSGYAYLLHNNQNGMGKAIYFIYVCGEKPKGQR